MPPKRKQSLVSSDADIKLTHQLKLLHVCGYCSQLVGGSPEQHSDHVKSHENEITQCRSCCLPVKLGETENHLDEVHSNYRNSVKFSLEKSLIELRIAARKNYSSFWGLCLPALDTTLQRFSVIQPRWWNHFKNGRSIGAFLIRNSKLNWRCCICENKPTVIFNETISMRAYVLSHLEEFHLKEIIQNEPGFFEFEWSQLHDECDFDMRSVMSIAEHRLKITNRSFRTFYTVNLSRMDNGEKFVNLLKKRNRMDDDVDVRYCLVCCSLVPVKSISNHFRAVSHAYLESVPESTSFTLIDRKSQSSPAEPIITDETTVAEEEQSFRFPEELFLYSHEYVNLRRDEFKWRCCLCPRAHALPFATFIILRMYALRHIENHHKLLFTNEFLNFEWKSLYREMQASFDIRSFTPLQYTLKGENTFNKSDPNDYMLPQQYYFLPMEYAEDTAICGFCFRSFNHINFLLHIAMHGFATHSSETLELQPIEFSSVAMELMGQHNYADDGSCEDEPHKILSVNGKRLKAKMDLMNSQRISPYFSEFSTPCKSERDTDGEQQTPRSRKSAVDAKRILTETFKILKENARNRKDTWNQSSSSSSSDDDDNSEDERFEKNMEKESARVSSQRSETPRSRSRQQNVPDLNKMKPAEIRRWIRNEADKNGWTYKSESSSSSDDSDSSDPEAIDNIDKMRPAEIRKLIQKEAIKRGRTYSSSSSSDSEDSESKNVPTFCDKRSSMEKDEFMKL